MWRAPCRPRENDISQSYNDGLVDLYRQTDGAQPGRSPRPVLSKVGTLAFAEQRLGLQRYYAGKQNQVQIERVIRVPRGFPVTSQMAAVIRGAKMQYRIDLVQSVPDNDLTGGNGHAETCMTGATDLYTKVELDPWGAALGKSFDRFGISWDLVLVEYEEETGFWHWSWDWEVV